MQSQKGIYNDCFSLDFSNRCLRSSRRGVRQPILLLIAMTAYYNEFDPYAAQWLRNLIDAGHIAKGEVDERSIADINPDDLKGFTQCHFFAGIGGWSLAARLAGWPDDRPLWTGSCPCQPFSVAGKGKGQNDERHLWPVFFDLIKARRPPVVMGEQVAAAVGKSWLDGVFTDLESIGYATGAAVVPACAVNAPHRRDRLWFVGDNLGNSEHYGQSPVTFRRCDAQAIQHDSQGQDSPKQPKGTSASGNVPSSTMADTSGSGRDERQQDASRMPQRVETQGSAGRPSVNSNGSCNVADTECIRQSRQGQLARSLNPTASCTRQADRLDHDSPRAFWHGAEYITGPDGKARRIEPSIRLLLDGLPSILERLRSVQIRSLEEIEGYANESQNNPREILRMVRETVQQEACWQKPSIRMRLKLPSPEILLSFLLRAQSACETKDTISFKKNIDEDELRNMRSMWGNEGNISSPRRWQSAEQYGFKSSNPLLTLSFILARYAEAYWEEARSSHAASNRAGMLKAYGNAIVAQVAAEVIKSYMETRP